MTLKIQSHEDDKRQLNVTVEVDEMRVKKAMKQTARKYAGEVSVPGFRKGKAPYHIIVQLVGEEGLRHDALHDLVPAIYEETMKELDVLPYAQPKVTDIDEGTPAVMTLLVPLEPVVELGDYRAMRKVVEPVDIKEEAVDEQIKMLRESKAETETIDRAAEMGDIVVVAGKGYLDDDEDDIIFNEEAFDISLQDDGIFAETNFISELVGSTADSSKSFTVPFPDEYEYEELAGKTATFNLDIAEVKAKTLPPLDDALAQMVDENIGSLDELRTTIRENLQNQAEEQFKNDLLTGAVEQMLDDVEEMAYPQGTVDAEIDGMVEDMKGRVEQAGMSWENWLQSTGRTVEDLRDDYEDAAVDRVEHGLVMRAFIQSEQLYATDEDIDIEVEKRVAQYLEGMTVPAADDDDEDNINDDEVVSDDAETESEVVDAVGENESSEEGDDDEVVSDDAEAESDAVGEDDEDEDYDDEEEIDTNAAMAEMFRSFYKSSGRPMLEQEIVMGKIHDRILAIYAGEAPDLPEPAETAESTDEETAAEEAAA